jgi:ABC-type antimicrobial peptide transport system permease subunit
MAAALLIVAAAAIAGAAWPARQASRINPAELLRNE